MEHKHTNRLINEKSPYLLQHAHNPVDWYSWGEEAFNKAKDEQKPVFLSVGYSTCHWCHVMERESFEDEEVAALLNEHYVAIKVDREERPDIDSIYMAVCQALTGQGGWPLTIVMTPTQKPFFAGTYFPKKRRMGMPGLMEILPELHRLWTTEKDKVVASGEEIAGAVGKSYFRHEAGQLSDEVMQRAYDYYEQSFDPDFGGFGKAPKFPTPHNLSFLMRYWKMTGEKKALDMVEATLEGMYRGGMYDHVGFGFSRYSTDRRWLVPHFEKMLYDNALLAIAYLEAYQATGKPFYAKVAREIFTYVLRDMTSPEGAFYSAEDADSEGEEGKFYLWTPGEVKELLGPERGKEFCRVYDITERGNFEGASIPNLIASGLTEGWEKERHSLFLKRESRVHPFKDDKVLTAWNGMMIAALSFGARVLQDKKYADAAEKATEFILNNLRRKDGRLLARYRKGEAAHLAYLEDYAYLVWGLTELYQATFKARYLSFALEFNDAMLSFFWDEHEGGFFQYAVDAEALISRPKEIYDGALPSGNSVAALNLLRLAGFTEDENLKKIARMQIKAFGGSVAQSPPGHAFFLMAYFFDAFPTAEVTVVGDPQEVGTKELLAIANKYFKPEMLVTLKAPGASNHLEEIVPSLAGRNSVGDKPTVYLCQEFACQPPVTDPVVLDSMLASPIKYKSGV